ncbi:MAG: AarF/ABC1/UbiB kinase family protein [Pseudomonadota bacterium]
MNDEDARLTPSAARPVPVPSGRLARLTRLGAMTAGVAGDMAWNGAAELGRGRRPSWRGLLMTPANVTRIADQLARMRGAAMKVGQLVSMDAGEVLPPELAEIMGRLRADAHFMPPEQLRRVLDREWPKGWRSAFARFDLKPMAAASIGQVHRARLKDGRELAVKIQYPGVARSIDSDVANVGALIRMAGLLPEGFDLAPYLAAACEQLREETDYELEGRHLEAFRALLDGDERFVLPERVGEWTTGRILAMSFVPGEPIEAAEALPQADRDRIARDLNDLLFKELLDFGVMQTDPNFANYRYDADSGRLVLLDFGATRRVEPEIAALYRRLFRAGLNRDEAALEAAAEEIGFVDAATAPEHRARILRMAGLVFEALTRERLFDYAGSDLSARMQAEGMALAEAGFVPPPLPIDVLYLQRKFGGVFLLSSRLRARVPVVEMLEAHLGRAEAGREAAGAAAAGLGGLGEPDGVLGAAL